MAASMSHSNQWKISETQTSTTTLMTKTNDIFGVKYNSDCTLIKCDSLNNALRQFYRDKKVTMNNLNPDETELIKALQGSGVDILELDPKNNTATLQINDHEHIGEVIKHVSRSFDVTLTSSSQMLCIANLHPDYSDEQLQQLVSLNGAVSRCFVYRCLETGESLGYGFVEFDCSMEKTQQIQQALDWKCIDNHCIHCEMVDVTSYEQLLSRCLLIDNLPKDFTDVMALREIFSICYSPIYCQIVMKGSDSLGFGIIEYKDHIEAKRSRIRRKDYCINGQAIRLTYCIPGKSGIFMCSKILTKYGSAMKTVKKGLLPDPVFPNDSLMKNPLVKQLCQQYPELLNCFKQALDQLQQKYVSQMTGSSKPGLLGPAPSAALNPLINPNMQFGLMVLLALQIQSRSQNKIVGPMDLLGLINNMQDGKSSLLGNPLAVQAKFLLKNLTSQLSPVQPLISDVPNNRNQQHNIQHTTSLLQSVAANIKNVNLNLLINLGQLSTSLQSSATQKSTSGVLGNAPEPKNKNMSTGILGNVPSLGSALEPNNKNMSLGILGNMPSLEGAPEPRNKNMPAGILGNVPKPLLKNPNSAHKSEKPVSLLDIDTTRYHKDCEIVPGAINSAVKENIPSAQGTQHVDAYHRNRSQELDNQQTELYCSGDQHRKSQTPSTNLCQNRNPPLIRNQYQSVSQYDNRNLHSSPQTGNLYGRAADMCNMNAELLNSRVPQQYGSQKISQTHGNSLLGMPKQEHTRLTSRTHDPQEGLLPPPSGRIQEGLMPPPGGRIQEGLMPPPGGRIQEGLMPPPGGRIQLEHQLTQNKIPRQFNTYLDQATLSPLEDSAFSSVSSGEAGFLSRRSRSQTSSLSDYSDSFTDLSSLYDSYRSNDSLYSDGRRSTSASLSDDGLLKTPIGQKRSYSHLLPAPEPSPEGEFIGQHSQGIGGHYADSYRKRPKLDREDLKLRF